ncbi:hypothetical protein KIPB_011911, partial [Kipferlia bialata]|eukprot:g11911.t1
MQLPVGVSVVSPNYALATEAPTGRKALPLPSLQSNILLNIRYRGDDAPEGYIRLHKVSASHPSLPGTVQSVRYWDHSDTTVFKPSREGVWTLTVETGYRLCYDPFVDECEDWTPHSTTHDIETTTVQVRVLPLTDME